jgi:hypothetical protein
MTCIVGIVENGKVYMGGDAAGVNGYSVRVRKDPKLFKVGEFLFGYTSSFRMGQLLGGIVLFHQNIILMSPKKNTCM